MTKTRILLIILFVVLYAASAVKTVNKAKEGRGAFIRQSRYAEMISHKEIPYRTSTSEEELYANLPMMLLIQKPFYAMGLIWGSFFWVTFKCMIILFIFWVVVIIGRGKGPPWPEWAQLLLLFLNIRVFFGDLTHANVNLFTAGLVAASLWFAVHRQRFASGLVVGFAAALRVTPMLFVVYFIYKRRWISLLGAIAGIVLFAWLVPGLFLGFEYHNMLAQAWFNQMILPFIKGENFTSFYHINQSFSGQFHRLLMDTVAIKADIKRGYDALKINLVAWDFQTVSIIVKLSYIIVVACLAWFCRTPKEKYAHPGNLGEYAIVFLATVFISPRSWKHTYVLIILAHGFILYYLLSMRPSGWRKWLPLVSLVFASICLLLFSDSTIGRYWSNVAEAYGIYLMGGIALFVGCAAILSALRLDDWPEPSPAQNNMPARRVSSA